MFRFLSVLAAGPPVAVLAFGPTLLLSSCGDDPAVPGLSPLDAELRVLLSAAEVTELSALPPEPTPLVDLGRLLFFDKVLSGNRNISCATCHHPTAFTGDALPVSIGEGGVGTGAQRQMGDGVLVPRNSPAVFNGDRLSVMFWDGRLSLGVVGPGLQTPEPGLNGSDPSYPEATPLNSALAGQAMFPPTSHEEMRGWAGENEVADAETNLEVWRALTLRLVGDGSEANPGFTEYRELFRAAFPDLAVPDDVTFGHAARALAAFETEAWRAESTPFDRYLRGDRTALSDQEKEGAILFFGRAGCAECHRGPLLTDESFHAMAVPQLGPGKGEPSQDRGRELETGDPEDRYRFRTPPLRNVLITGPWMHDGSFTSLGAALDHVLDPAASLAAYDPAQLPVLFRGTVDLDPARNAERAQSLDDLVGPVVLEEGEREALLSFLIALTDPASLDLLDDIPARVPSGLPVHDGR
jgi:cytochrome c peroxidase